MFAFTSITGQQHSADFPTSHLAEVPCHNVLFSHAIILNHNVFNAENAASGACSSGTKGTLITRLLLSLDAV